MVSIGTVTKSLFFISFVNPKIILSILKKHISVEVKAKNLNDHNPPYVSNKYPPSKLPKDSPVNTKYIKYLFNTYIRK